jgi:hypothetical protein
MLDSISSLQNIYLVTKLIYDQTPLVKTNQEQCKRLAEHIRIIEQSLHNMKQKNKDEYRKRLNDVLMGLENCLKFWFKKAAKLGDTQAATLALKLEAALAPPTEYSLVTPQQRSI